MNKEIFVQTQEAMQNDIEAMQTKHAEAIAKLQAELEEARKP
jgi:hypothetical protein